MSEYTTEQLAMARRIVESTRIDGPLGKGPPNAERAALAAIIETTEVAAKLAEEYAQQCLQAEGNANAMNDKPAALAATAERLGATFIAVSLRNFEHLAPTTRNL